MYDKNGRERGQRSEVGGRPGRFAAKIYFVTRARSREEDAEPYNHTPKESSDIHTAIHGVVTFGEDKKLEK
jgi:hypothetical protein